MIQLLSTTICTFGHGDIGVCVSQKEGEEKGVSIILTELENHYKLGEKFDIGDIKKIPVILEFEDVESLKNFRRVIDHAIVTFNQSGEEEKDVE